MKIIFYVFNRRVRRTDLLVGQGERINLKGGSHVPLYTDEINVATTKQHYKGKRELLCDLRSWRPGPRSS